MAAVLSGPLQPPATRHAEELASLAVNGQVDGIRGLIIQPPLATSVLPPAGSSLHKNVTPAVIACSNSDSVTQPFLAFIEKPCITTGKNI